MKLYQLPYSHFSAKVRIVLIEKGLPVEYPDLPDQSGPEADQYRSINPTGKVPCLIDGDFVVGESEVIAEYLEGQYPDIPMLPQGEQQKARSRWLSRYHDLYVAPQVTVLFLMTMDETVTETKIDTEVKKLFEILDVLESASASQCQVNDIQNSASGSILLVNGNLPPKYSISAESSMAWTALCSRRQPDLYR